MSQEDTLRKLCVSWPGDRKDLPKMENWHANDVYAWRLRDVAFDGGPLRDRFHRMIVRDCFHRVEKIFDFINALHDFAAPGCQLIIDGPYGSSDNCDLLDSRRRMWADTCKAFEPAWRFKQRTFYLDGFFFEGNEDPVQLGAAVANLRNVVKGFAAELIAQKPVPDGYKAQDPISAFKVI